MFIYNCTRSHFKQLQISQKTDLKERFKRRLYSLKRTYNSKINLKKSFFKEI